MTASERLLPRLEGVRARGPDRWVARCPSHEDRNPSLAIRQVEDRLLVRCWTGCRTTAIVAALGLKLADLFDNARTKTDPETERRKRIVEGFSRWREAEVVRLASQLRTRDAWIAAIVSALDAGLLTEAEATDWLQIQIADYSSLEWKFDTLWTGQTQEAYAIFCEG